MPGANSAGQSSAPSPAHEPATPVIDDKTATAPHPPANTSPPPESPPTPSQPWHPGPVWPHHHSSSSHSERLRAQKAASVTPLNLSRQREAPTYTSSFLSSLPSGSKRSFHEMQPDTTTSNSNNHYSLTPVLWSEVDRLKFYGLNMPSPKRVQPNRQVATLDPSQTEAADSTGSSQGQGQGQGTHYSRMMTRQHSRLSLPDMMSGGSGDKLGLFSASKFSVIMPRNKESRLSLARSKLAKDRKRSLRNAKSKTPGLKHLLSDQDATPRKYSDLSKLVRAMDIAPPNNINDATNLEDTKPSSMMMSEEEGEYTSGSDEDSDDPRPKFLRPAQSKLRTSLFNSATASTSTSTSQRKFLVLSQPQHQHQHQPHPPQSQSQSQSRPQLQPQPQPQPQTAAGTTATAAAAATAATSPTSPKRRIKALPIIPDLQAREAGAPPFDSECTICNKIFRRRTDYDRHLASKEHLTRVGQAVSKWPCEHCGGSFTRRDAMLRHQRNTCPTKKSRPKKVSIGDEKKVGKVKAIAIAIAKAPPKGKVVVVGKEEGAAQVQGQGQGQGEGNKEEKGGEGPKEAPAGGGGGGESRVSEKNGIIKKEHVHVSGRESLRLKEKGKGINYKET